MQYQELMATYNQQLHKLEGADSPWELTSHNELSGTCDTCGKLSGYCDICDQMHPAGTVMFYTSTPKPDSPYGGQSARGHCLAAVTDYITFGGYTP